MAVTILMQALSCHNLCFEGTGMSWDLYFNDIFDHSFTSKVMFLINEKHITITRKFHL